MSVVLEEFISFAKMGKLEFIDTKFSKEFPILDQMTEEQLLIWTTQKSLVGVHKETKEILDTKSSKTSSWLEFCFKVVQYSQAYWHHDNDILKNDIMNIENQFTEIISNNEQTRPKNKILEFWYCIFLNFYGAYTAELGEYDHAVKIFEKGLEIAIKTDFKLMIAAITHNAANISYTAGRLKEAEDAYSKCLEISMQMNHFQYINASLMSLASVLQKQGKFDEAWEIFENGTDKILEAKDPTSIFILYERKGVHKNLVGEPVEALHFAREALRYAEKIDNIKYIAESEQMIGDCYQKLGLPSVAIEHYLKAIDVFNNISHQSHILQTHKSLSFCYHLINEQENAIKHLIKMIKISINLGRPGNIMEGLIIIEKRKLDKEIVNSYLIENKIKNKVVPEKIKDQVHPFSMKCLKSVYDLILNFQITTSTNRTSTLDQIINLEKDIDEISEQGLKDFLHLVLLDLKLQIFIHDYLLSKQNYDLISRLAFDLSQIYRKRSNIVELVDVFLLQSTIEQIEGKIGVAEKLLVEAITLTQQKGAFHLLPRLRERAKQLSMQSYTFNKQDKKSLINKLGKSKSDLRSFNEILGSLIIGSEQSEDSDTKSSLLESKIDFASVYRSNNDAKEILHHKDIFHPVKILILKLFNQFFRIPRAEITSLLNLNKDQIKPHLEYLIKHSYLDKTTEFIENKPRIVIYATERSRKKYQNFVRMMHQNLL